VQPHSAVGKSQAQAYSLGHQVASGIVDCSEQCNEHRSQEHVEQRLGPETMEYHQSDTQVDIGGLSDDEQELLVENDLDHAHQLLQVNFGSERDTDFDEDDMDGSRQQVSSLFVHPENA
jgi:hypothetical protein